jgi:hypothetical protein
MKPVETCSIEGCFDSVKSRTWCGKHLQRWYRYGTTDDPVRSETRTCRQCSKVLPRKNFRTAIPVCEYCYPEYMMQKYGPCNVDGCDRIIKARGWCDLHLARWYRWGTTSERERPKEVECLRCHQMFLRKDFPSPKERHCTVCLPLQKQERNARRVSRSANAAAIIAKMRADQENKCKICGIPEEKAPRGRLAVDHCHETGQLRGLLCNNCNVGLGQFKDNPNLLTAAIEYLQSSPSPAN